MIGGVFEKTENGTPPAELLHRMLAADNTSRLVEVLFSGPVALGSLDETGVGGASLRQRPGHRGERPPANCTLGKLSIVWQGQIYNRPELAQSLPHGSGVDAAISDGELLLRLYETHGHAGIEKINGRFAFAIYDQARQEIVLGRDHFGIETLYYYDGPKSLVFGSRIAPVVAHPDVRKELNLAALRRYLVFNYNPASDTFFRGIRKLRPGSLAILSANGLSEKRYWFLSFQRGREKSLSEYCHDVRALMRDAVRLRAQGAPSLGIFLSGGMDSSTVAVLTHEIVSGGFSTFSYRCLGKSFDESGYARIVAQH